MNAKKRRSGNKLSRIVNADMNRRYRRNILRVIAWTGTLVSLTYAALLWFVFDHALSSTTDIFYALCYVSTLFWIRRAHFSFSAYWMIFWACIQISTGSIFFVSPETGFQLYFLTLPVIVYLLLSQQPTWAQIATMIFGCLAFIASHVIHVEAYRAPIPQPVSQTIFILNALVVFAIVFLAVKFFADEIETAYREQKKLVLQDSLTGLFNDRYIEQHASKLFSLCDRYGHPLSMIMLKIPPIESMKELDTSGTQCVLRHIAGLLLEDVRDADIIARMNEQAFLIILPETLQHEAEEIAARLCRRVAEHPFDYEGMHYDLSLDAGVSYCDSQVMETIDTMIASADDAIRSLATDS